ncbi:hypothetical protein MASR1M31_21600 [Porphyromonadaceae bacterium]
MRRVGLNLVIIIISIFIVSIALPNFALGEITDIKTFEQLDNARQDRIISTISTNTHDSLNQETKLLETEAVKRFEKPESEGYIVKFRDDVEMQNIFNIVSLYDYEIIGQSNMRTFMIYTADFECFEHLVSGLIDYIEKDEISKRLEAIPNDAYYNNQWALPALKLPEGWNLTTGSNLVKVAVLDSGIEHEHLRLVNSDIRWGWDYPLNRTLDWDSNGHGTNVTGVIAAKTNNGLGIVG